MGTTNSRSAEALNDKVVNKAPVKALQANVETDITALVAVGGPQEWRQGKVCLSDCKRRGLSNQLCKHCETRESKALDAKKPQAEADVKQENIVAELSSNGDSYELRKMLRNRFAGVEPTIKGRGDVTKQFGWASNKERVYNGWTRETRLASAVQNADAAASGNICVKHEEQQINSPPDVKSSLPLLATVEPDPTHLTDVDYKNGIDIKPLTPAVKLEKTETPALQNSLKIRNCRVRLKELSAVIKQENSNVLALAPKKNRTPSNARKSKISIKSPKRRVLRSHVCGNNRPEEIKIRKYGTPLNANKRRCVTQQHLSLTPPAIQFNKSVRVRLKRIHSTKDIEACCNKNAANNTSNDIKNRKQAKLQLYLLARTRTSRNAKEVHQKVAQKQNKTPTATAHAQLLGNLQPTVALKRLNLHRLCQLESGGYLVSDAFLQSCDGSSPYRPLCNTSLSVKLEKTAERLVYDSVKLWPAKRSVCRKIKQEVNATAPIEVSATADSNLSIQRAYSLYPVVRLKRFKLPPEAEVVVNQKPQLPALDCTKQESPDMQLEHSTPNSYAVFVKQEEDSGISLHSFEASPNRSMTSGTPSLTASEAACDLGENILVQIATQRAYINAILLQNGYSPIQFKLYNNIDDLKIVLDYLLVK